MRELNGLQRALNEIKHLEGTPGQTPAIMAFFALLQLPIPLSEFQTKPKKYGPSLGVGRSDVVLKDVGKKLKWQLKMKDEV